MAKIKKALYGKISNDQISGIEVTSKIKVGEIFNNKTAGNDPFPGKKKVLYIELEDGTSFIFPEGMHVDLEGKNWCPVCNGSGYQTLTIYEDGKENKVEIDCIYCENIPMEESEAINLSKRIKKEENRWCKCGNPSGDATYVDDTKSRKHHWNCNDCGKMYQEG